MSCRHALLHSFAIGLTIFTNVGVVNARSVNARLGLAFCVGQYSTLAECNKAAANESTIQGFPISPISCSVTCEKHLGFKRINCGNDAHAYAAKICGGTPTTAFPSEGGNQCGYNWFTVTCPPKH